MFIDQITIHAKAGKGGNGVTLWLHEKGKEFMGPAGGDGGKGGDIYVETVSDMSVLLKYRNVKEFTAENGDKGGNKSRSGKRGEDTTIQIPVGSIVQNLNTKKIIELNVIGEKIKILSGGQGGLGNERFKSSINRAPTKSTKGKHGEEADFKIDLRIIADVGLVGFPNAGKTSLLNALTSSKAKVADYAFTTIEPSLGVMNKVVIADIPGLIEGAHTGKGLGHNFLKHIQKTKLILYCISSDTEDVLEAYSILNNELKSFDDSLTNLPKIILLTKTDLIDISEVEKKKEILGKDTASVSILDKDLIFRLKKLIEEKVFETHI